MIQSLVSGFVECHGSHDVKFLARIGPSSNIAEVHIPRATTLGTALKLSPPEVELGIDLGRKGNCRDRKRVSHQVGPTRTWC